VVRARQVSCTGILDVTLGNGITRDDESDCRSGVRRSQTRFQSAEVVPGGSDSVCRVLSAIGVTLTSPRERTRLSSLTGQRLQGDLVLSSQKCMSISWNIAAAMLSAL
jgi:hypothetical protein